MANSVNVQISHDGPRNAVAKIVGIADSSDLAQSGLITLAQFPGDNDARRTLSGLKVVDADYSGTPGLIVLLDWNSNPVQPICALSTSMEFRGRRHGGFSPNTAVLGYDGSINLSTRGFIPGTVYGFTVNLRMVKKYSS